MYKICTKYVQNTKNMYKIQYGTKYVQNTIWSHWASTCAWYSYSWRDRLPMARDVPAMQYMRTAIAQYLIHMCPDEVSATDTQRQGSASGNLQLSPMQIDALMNFLSLNSPTHETRGDISVFSTVLIHNKLFAGDQRLRCFPFGEGYQFHSKNIQDCCFAIPARKSPDTFDISDPSDDKELVFGRLYCIFRIELVSDMDIDGEPEERDLVLLKVLFLILFCYNFVHIFTYFVYTL